MAISLEASWPSIDAYIATFDAEIAKGGLLVRGASVGNPPAGAEVSLSLKIGSDQPLTISARIAAVIPGVGVAVMFDAAAKQTLESLKAPPLDAEVLTAEPESSAPAAEEEAPEEKQRIGPLSERMKTMTVNEKMQLALTGTRDERQAILRDTNKSLHLFVFKNPRIGLDEVAAAAKAPNTSPDALKMIAEHREWGSNAGICASLVRNPKTPMPLAMRAIEKVSVTDLRAIAKGGARDALVQAARKKIA
ncbi:MAG: hypothetical protein JNM17_01255 [Archangium sp.]|nr:hypothetical protein [Archangium sp.]